MGWKKFLREKGSTLMQVMVMAAMTSGIALVLTKISGTLNKATKNTEMKQAESQVVNRINEIFRDELNCTLNATDPGDPEIQVVSGPPVFSGVPGALPTTIVPADGLTHTLNDIYYCANSEQVDVNPNNIPTVTEQPILERRCTDVRRYMPLAPPNDTIENGKIRVEVGLEFVNAGGAMPDANIIIRLTRQGAGTQSYGVAQKTERIPLSYETVNQAPGERLKKCFSRDTNMINTAVHRACRGNNARIVVRNQQSDGTSTLSCEHDVEKQLVCAQDEYFNGYAVADANTGAYDWDNDPATTTDTITIGAGPSPTTPDGRSRLVPICVKITNKHLGPSECADGQYMVQYQGTFACIDIPECNNEGTGAFRTKHLVRETTPGPNFGFLKCENYSNCPNGSLPILQNDGSIACLECGQDQVVMKVGSSSQDAWKCVSTTCGPDEKFVGLSGNGPICIPNLIQCPGTNGSESSEKQYVKNLTINAQGSVEAECCTPNCNDADKICRGQVYPSGSTVGSQNQSNKYGANISGGDGCRFCVGERPQEHKYWSEWTCGVGAGGGDLCTDSKFCPTCEVCRARDGGQVSRTRTCLGNQVCGGQDFCNGETSQSETITCAAALDTNGTVTSTSTVSLKGWVVPGQFRAILLGGGGGGASAYHERRGGYGGKAGNWTTYTSPSSTTTWNTSCRFNIGKRGSNSAQTSGSSSHGNSWGYSGGTTSISSCNGLSASATGGAGGQGANGEKTSGSSGQSRVIILKHTFHSTNSADQVGWGGGGGSRETTCDDDAADEYGKHASGVGAGGGGGATDGKCRRRGGMGSKGKAWYWYKYTPY